MSAHVRGRRSGRRGAAWPVAVAGICAIALIVIAVVVAGAGASGESEDTRYYVSLGDSLAGGVQPDAEGHNGITGEGYTDVVERSLGRAARDLRHLKLGCQGTTATLISGESCDARYGPGGQLAQAERLLRRHRRRTSLVTIGIGDNDVEACLGDGRIDRRCVARGMRQVRRNLPRIAARLRAAAGPETRMVGVTDYDQFLAYWLRGGAERDFARASVIVIRSLNLTMAAIYRRAGFGVADAWPAFRSGELRARTALRGRGRVPLAVARICRWTWACSHPPIGFNDHANATGYRVIARVVLAAAAANPHG